MLNNTLSLVPVDNSKFQVVENDVVIEEILPVNDHGRHSFVIGSDLRERCFASPEKALSIIQEQRKRQAQNND